MHLTITNPCWSLIGSFWLNDKPMPPHTFSPTVLLQWSYNCPYDFSCPWSWWWSISVILLHWHLQWTTLHSPSPFYSCGMAFTMSLFEDPATLIQKPIPTELHLWPQPHPSSTTVMINFCNNIDHHQCMMQPNQPLIQPSLPLPNVQTSLPSTMHPFWQSVRMWVHNQVQPPIPLPTPTSMTLSNWWQSKRICCIHRAATNYH